MQALEPAKPTASLQKGTQETHFFIQGLHLHQPLQKKQKRPP